MTSVISNPFGIDNVVLASGNAKRTFDLQGRNHRKCQMMFIKEERELHGIQARVFEAEEHDSARQFSNDFQPVQKCRETFYFIIKALVSLFLSDIDIQTQLGDVNANINLIRHDKKD